MTDSEINEAVARKLGWKSHIKKKQNWGVWKKKGFEDIPYRLLPPYSTSIEAAWEIIESMKYERVKVIKRWDKGWECHILTDDITKAEADTAPMAICLAFLKLEDK